LTVEEGLDDGEALGDVEVEALLAEVVAEDEGGDRRPEGLVGLGIRIALLLQGLPLPTPRLVVEGDEQERERGDALLAVDEVELAAALRDDDGAEEVVLVPAHGLRPVTGLEARVELPLEVGEELVDVRL